MPDPPPSHVPQRPSAPVHLIRPRETVSRIRLRRQCQLELVDQRHLQLQHPLLDPRGHVLCDRVNSSKTPPLVHYRRRRTVVTCLQPRNFNMSQYTSINESIVVMRRPSDGPYPPTRFIHLDRMPADESEVENLHRCLLECSLGQTPNGWGEVSQWPADRMAEGNWTPAIWRLAAHAYADCEGMMSIEQEDIYQAGRRVCEFCKEARENDEDCFALLYSKGADDQTKITAVPDRYYKPKDPTSERCLQGVSNLKSSACHRWAT